MHFRLVLGDQLFAKPPDLDTQTKVLMVESPDLTKRFRYHQYRLAYTLTCMREYAHYLESKGYKVDYRKFDPNIDFQTIFQDLTQNGLKKLSLIQPADKYFRNYLTDLCQDLKIELEFLQNPGFLTPLSVFKDYFEQLEKSQAKGLLLNTFYIFQRRRLGLYLEEGNKPFLGSWSFDSQNRQKLPKDIKIEPRFWDNSKVEDIFSQKTNSKSNQNYQAVLVIIQKYFPDNPGQLLKESWLPLNHNQAKVWLQDFIQNYLLKFGPYQDSLTQKDSFVFHSVLSPMINNGLLTPDQILKEIDIYLKLEIDEQTFIQNFNSIEGFIRQLIGWREWVRGLYEFKYPENFRELNYFQAKVDLPDYFYNPYSKDAELEANIPLKSALQKTHDLAWNHHIERLMVIANWMTLNSYDPAQCFDWFMSQYTDSYEWVMLANVYGMGLYADGGLFATKPYISGGNYLLKMSDYKDTGWSKIWTTKYWEFLKKHKIKLSSNPRMKLILSKV